MDHTASAFRLTSSKPPPTSATFRPCRAEIKTQEFSSDFWSVTRRVTIGDTQTPVTKPSTQRATSGIFPRLPNLQRPLEEPGPLAAGAPQGLELELGAGRSPDGNAWRRDRAAEKRAALPTGALLEASKNDGDGAQKGSSAIQDDVSSRGGTRNLVRTGTRIWYAARGFLVRYPLVIKNLRGSTGNERQMSLDKLNKTTQQQQYTRYYYYTIH
jgi:hypothetical protein